MLVLSDDSENDDDTTSGANGLNCDIDQLDSFTTNIYLTVDVGQQDPTVFDAASRAEEIINLFFLLLSHSQKRTR